jgi:hypothetical protein
MTHRKIFLTSLVFFAVFVALCFGLTLRLSDRFAVPAAQNHAATEPGEVPDGVSERGVVEYISIPYMKRAYCSAASQTKDTQALGGFAPSENYARPVHLEQNGKGLWLLAQPTVATKLDGKRGMRLLLVNQTGVLLLFTASDSRLPIVQEALDESGQWQPIEYLPSSWCGNSRHRVFLAPGYFWEFGAPRYQGSLATKLRFSLALEDGAKMTSNVFEGSVNPEQFSIQEGHAPVNLMDSYDN